MPLSSPLPDAIIYEPTSLGNFAALCSRASIVIANDSGVSHIASAVHAPQITIVGVTDTDRTSPWSDLNMIVGKKVSGLKLMKSFLPLIKYCPRPNLNQKPLSKCRAKPLMLIQSFWALAAAASFSTMAAFVKCPAMQPFGPLGWFLPLSIYPCLHLCSCPLERLFTQNY